MNPAPILARPWDYGWLCRDHVKLAAASSDAALIEQYVASPAFHMSFVPNDRDETGIHGPFVAERIKAADFVPLQFSELCDYLETIHLADLPAEDVVARCKILPHLLVAFESGSRCHVLRRDERNPELFHDWGTVLFVFREILFIDCDRNSVERFVIGYD